MERLTTRLPDGQAYYTECHKCEYASWWDDECLECDTGIKQCRKLADYEDAEEQGRLIFLPVAKGSTIYYVPDYLCGQDSRIEELYVMGYRIFEDGATYLRVKQTRFSGTLVNIKRIGEDVFLTREEAEAKLKEMEEQT